MWCIKVLVRFQSKSYVRPIGLVVVSTRLHMCMQHTPPDRYTKKESSQVQRYLTTTNTNFMVAIELMQRICYRIRVRTAAAAAPNNERKLVARCMNTIFRAIQISICNIFQWKFLSLANSHTVITMEAISWNQMIWKFYGESLLLAWNICRVNK